MGLAYAQPSPPQQSPPSVEQQRACPEGFTLNRGVCQADPTLDCSHLGEWYKLVDDQCAQWGFHIMPATLNPETGEYFCLNDPNVTPEEPDENNIRWCRAPILTGIVADPVVSCGAGTLNEESGKCETRPGRNVNA